MPGIEEIGFVIVIWGVVALIFRDTVVRFDLALRERLTGDFISEGAVVEQQNLLERTARVVLVAGLVIFAIGVGLHFTGAA